MQGDTVAKSFLPPVTEDHRGNGNRRASRPDRWRVNGFGLLIAAGLEFDLFAAWVVTRRKDAKVPARQNLNDHRAVLFTITWQMLENSAYLIISGQ